MAPDLTNAEQTIIDNRKKLRDFITYLKTNAGLRDELSIFFAQSAGFGLGDVRQMVDEKVNRVHQVTVNTNAELDRIVELAMDLLWLIKWFDTFMSKSDAAYPVPHTLQFSDEAFKEALVTRHITTT